MLCREGWFSSDPARGLHCLCVRICLYVCMCVCLCACVFVHVHAGAALFAMYIDPYGDHTVEEVHRELDRLAETVAEHVVRSSTTVEGVGQAPFLLRARGLVDHQQMCHHISEVLFVQLGFIGNTQDYHQLSNSLIHEVRGVCVCVCVCVPVCVCVGVCVWVWVGVGVSVWVCGCVGVGVGGCGCECVGVWVGVGVWVCGWVCVCCAVMLSIFLL